MLEKDDDPWWTQAGIKARWDEERDTGPQRVIIAKFAWEGAFPAIAGLVSAGSVAAFVIFNFRLTMQMVTVILSVFAGVFLFFYIKAGFKDSTIRDS